MSTFDELKATGGACIKASKFDEAVAAYSKAIEIRPEDHTVYANRSVAYIRSERYQEAFEDAEKCVELNPTWPKGYLRKGNAQYYLGQYEEARRTYAAGLQHNPEDKALMQALRTVTAETQDTNPFSNIGEMFQNPALLAAVRAHPTMAAFKDDAELDAIIEDLKVNPNNMGNHFQNKSFMQFLQTLMTTVMPGETTTERPEGFGAPEEAPAAVEEEEEPEPELSPEEIAEKELQERAALIKADADALFKKKDYVGAIAKYTEGMEVYDKEIRFVLNRAACHMSLKEYEKCIVDCDTAFTKGKEVYAEYSLMARAKCRKGDALSKLSMFKEAVTAYKESLTETRDPKVLKKLRATEKLVNDLKQKEYQDPVKAAEAKERGNAAFREGNTPKAVEEYTEAIKRDPTQVAYYCNRAAAYTKLLAIPQAISDCDRAIALDPKYEKAYKRKAAAYIKGEEFHSATRVYMTLSTVVPESSVAEAGIMEVRQAVAAVRAEGGERAQRVAERALRDKEIAALYQSPQVQSALMEAQKNPASLQRLMMKDEFIRDAVETLMGAGVI